MKPAEKIILLVGLVAILSLLGYKLWLVPQMRFRQWGECAPDIAATCTEPAGTGTLNVRRVKCLVERFDGLTPGCKAQVEQRYAGLLKKKQAPTNNGGFDVKKFTAPCEGYWSAGCAKQNLKSGKVMECFTKQPDFGSFPVACLDVMTDVATWDPKTCTEGRVKRHCGSYGRLRRLECILKNRKVFPKECDAWLATVDRIVKMRRSKGP